MACCPSPESVQKSHQGKRSSLSSVNQLPQPRSCREIFSLPSSTTHAKVNAVSYSWKYTISQKFGVILSITVPDARSWNLPSLYCWVWCLNLTVGFTAPPWNLTRLKTSVSTSDPCRKKPFVHYSPDLSSFLSLMKQWSYHQSCRCLFGEAKPSNAPVWFWFRQKEAAKAFSAGSGGRTTTPVSQWIVFYVSCRGIKY